MTPDEPNEADDVSRETEAIDAAPGYFGAAFDAVSRFAERLAVEGEERGLIGPRELNRIWSRHIYNSAAVVPYLPSDGVIADLGSGAGLPGIVIAAMLPDAEVLLVEPMERRCTWLSEMREHLGLTNVEVKRGRAEEFHGAFEADAVTARAVAALDKLARMSLPLVRPGGELVVLKGRNVEREVPAARKVLRRFGAGEPEILRATTIPAVDETVVVRVARPVPAR
ncbi:16S rRNA (guanine(527)-N(7))-methyltransferase RsmG [Luteimicrobium sp. NPDC057192]|uniref:16S rRNA (guanine(527)-N(7))-methyltransferase RsmG n=1 Tax=Luteimicrobium sp. NPDC057192 TaxID=3346042 RepID=UPI003636B92E